MKYRHYLPFGAALTAFALCVALLPAVAVSATTGTMQITTDTTLTEDHSGPIDVVADNVTLDCDGHAVNGSGTGHGIDVDYRTGVTVRNCTVRGFEMGIDLQTSNGNVVTGNTATANSRDGIHLSSSDNNTVTGNQAHDNNVYGFSLNGGSTGNTFTGNTSNDNGLDGFFSWESSGNTYAGNEAHANSGSGISDDAAVGASTYSKNHCTGNTNGGSVPSGLCQEEQVGLVNTASGEWHLRHSEGDITTFYYGNPGDTPFMGDWDCDKIATPGLFRTSDAFAYLRNSNTQGIADIRFFFGNPSDIPLAGDFNGDGCDTLSIYRPSEARFYIMNKLGENEGGLGAADYSFLFGNPGDKPVVGDWDGDGIDEIGLHRETTGFFYYRNTLTTGNADGQFYFGDPGDRLVAGDWGVVDGVETPAMYRPSNQTFYFRHTLTQGVADSQFTWIGAGAGWVPVAGGFAD